MTDSSLLKSFAALSILATLAACVSTRPTHVQSQTEMTAREPATIKNDAITKKTELHDAVKTDFKVGNLETKKYSLENREDRLEFKVKIEGLLARKDDRMSKEAELALEDSLNALAKLDTETPKAADFLRLQEAVEAYNSNFLAPVPLKLWIGALPIEAIKRIHHSIMNRRAPEAVNLITHGADDPSRVDPQPSSFWKPGREISKVDMYNGFGRSEIPKITKVCKYLSPKKSYGTRGGFKMLCGDKKWKIKFGNESKTEPFNSRLMWSLGYPVTVIDYVEEGLRISYDRRIVSEYNSRKKLAVEVKSMFGFNYFSKNLQTTLDPFADAVVGAELEDGTFVPSKVLRAKLIKSMPAPKGAADWNRGSEIVFNERFEKQIATLVLKHGSLEGESPANQKELGSWSWKTLDHPDRRELRAFALAAAWTNSFDMRQNNNKTIRVDHEDGTTELIQMVSDLGSGFGIAKNLFHSENELFNDMPWDLVRLRANEGDGDDDSNETMNQKRRDLGFRPFKFPSYSVIETNPTFSRMQLDDARWMARKLATLSEDQIQDGLIASGFTAAETKLVLEKLLDRRQQMINVFDLEKEFPELMERKINRRISFDPKKDAAPKTKNAANPVAARVTSQRLVKGRLEP